MAAPRRHIRVSRCSIARRRPNGVREGEDGQAGEGGIKFVAGEAQGVLPDGRGQVGAYEGDEVSGQAGVGVAGAGVVGAARGAFEHAFVIVGGEEVGQGDAGCWRHGFWMGGFWKCIVASRRNLRGIDMC